MFSKHGEHPMRKNRQSKAVLTPTPANRQRIKPKPQSYELTYQKAKDVDQLWVEIARPGIDLRISGLLELERQLRRRMPFPFCALADAEFRLHNGGRNAISVRLLITPANLERPEAILRLQEAGWGRGLEVAVIKL